MKAALGFIGKAVVAGLITHVIIRIANDVECRIRTKIFVNDIKKATKDLFSKA